MPLEELVTARVRRKLSALKLALCAHLVGSGLPLVVVALVGAVFLTLGIDRALDMDRAQRALIVGLSLAGVAYVSWRFLLRPLRVPMDAEELALVLERHYPQLEDRLISALQFASRDFSRTGASEAMIRQVARQANSLAGDLKASEAIESARTYKRLGLGGGALAVLLVFAVFNSQVMALWFQRDVLFRDVPWPRETYLRVAGAPEFKVVRGAQLRVVVTADANHVVPRHVTFHMDFPGLGTVSENIPAAAAGGNTYVKTFDNVADVFRFYVTGNDDRTDWCRVTVVDPPMLEDIRFTLEYPAYMNRPPGQVSCEHGELCVPPGSRILLDGRANKDLAGARLLLDGGVAGELRVKMIPLPGAADAGAAPRGVTGTLQLPVRLARSRLVMRFELTDVEGLTNRRGAAYVLRIERDRAPTVSLRRWGVRGEVTARAIIPLLIRCRDDYGIAAIELAVRSEYAPSLTTEPAGHPNRRTSRLGTPAAASRPAGERTLPVEDATMGKSDVQADYRLDLEPMRLVEGQIIRLRGIARDTLPEAFGGPNAARSPVQAFKIVPEHVILAELVRRQKEIRQELVRVVVFQADVRESVLALGDRLVTASRIEAADREGLKSADANQRRVAAQCGVLVRQLQQVLDEMSFNRVADPEDETHMRGKIIEPLRQICKKPMLDLAEAMVRASKETDVARLRVFSSQSAEILNGFIERLEAILEEMTQLTNRQELARILKQLIGEAETVRKLIQHRMKEQTGSVFDRAVRPGP